MSGSIAFLNRSKIGITLAYALMSVLIHAHNSSVSAKGKRITRPIHAVLPSSNYCPTRPMGVVKKQLAMEQGSGHWEMDLTENVLDMELVLSVFFQCIKKMHIIQDLQEMKLSSILQSVWSFQPYSLTTKSLEYSTTSSLHERLSNYGLILSNSEKDGNCFLYLLLRTFVMIQNCGHQSSGNLVLDMCSFLTFCRKNLDKFLFLK